MKTSIHASTNCSPGRGYIFWLLKIVLFPVLAGLCFTGNVQAQTQQWAQTYDGTTHQTDRAHAMAVDNVGNTYIAGITNGFTTNGIQEGIMLLAKYDASGTLLWSQSFIGASFTIGYANAVAIDGNGDVVIAGGCSNFDDVNSSFWEIGDYFTVKYDAGGQLLWSQSYNGPANHHDFANSLAIDASNNIYVTGSSVTSASTQKFDIATVKYDANGIQQWVHRYNGTANGDDYGTKIISKIGGLYVCGSSWGTGMDMLTLKLEPSGGSLLWTGRCNATNSDGETAADMAVDGVGSVYVTGKVNNFGKPAGSNIDANWVTLKYNSSGVQQWVKAYDGNAADQYAYNASVINNDYPTALTIDNTGNIYVTGRSFNKTGSGNNASTSLDMTTVKYNTSGSQVWAKTYDGPSKGEDCANAIATDGAGNIYITGRSFAANQSMNAVIVKYNASGSQQWVTSYNSGTFVPDEAAAIVVDGAGKVCIAGSAGQDALLVKYGQPAGTFRLSPGTGTHPLTRQLTVYPNPVKDKLIILDETELGTIRLRDQTGKIVLETTIQEFKTEIDMSHLAAGLYFLTTGRTEGPVSIFKN